jgi:hypothetical protein
MSDQTHLRPTCSGLYNVPLQVCQGWVIAVTVKDLSPCCALYLRVVATNLPPCKLKVFYKKSFNSVKCTYVILPTIAAHCCSGEMGISSLMVYDTDGNKVVFHPLAWLIWVGFARANQPHKSNGVM